MKKIKDIVLRLSAGFVRGIPVDAEVGPGYDSFLIGIAEDLVSALRRFHHNSKYAVGKNPAGCAANKGYLLNIRTVAACTE